MRKIIDVSGGAGCKVFLIIGDEKSAIIDCGMPHTGEKLIENIKRELGGKQLDYIILTHSHYDHAAALPVLREEFTDVKVFAHSYAKGIFSRKGAKRTIKHLSEIGAEHFGEKLDSSIDFDLLSVDTAIADGDKIYLGGCVITAFETPGHTQCSMSFVVDNDALFLSETTGCKGQDNIVLATYVISYKSALENIKRLRNLGDVSLYAPHYGLIEDISTAEFWLLAENAVVETKEYILKMHREGFDIKTMLIRFREKFYPIWATSEQPEQAYILNTTAMIDAVLNDR